MAQERVFPIFLDGAVQDVDGSSNTDWNGETSRVVVTPTGALIFTVGDATVPGTLICVANDAASQVFTVRFSSPFAGLDAFNDVLLNNAGESVTAMWTGSEWFIMGSTETVVVE